MKKLVFYIMYCEDDAGEYELWFDSKKKLIDGYFCNDASWRDEYFNGIFRKFGVNIKSIPYKESIARKAVKQLWNFEENEN